MEMGRVSDGYEGQYLIRKMQIFAFAEIAPKYPNIKYIFWVTTDSRLNDKYIATGQFRLAQTFHCSCLSTNNNLLKIGLEQRKANFNLSSVKLLSTNKIDSVISEGMITRLFNIKYFAVTRDYRHNLVNIENIKRACKISSAFYSGVDTNISCLSFGDCGPKAHHAVYSVFIYCTDPELALQHYYKHLQEATKKIEDGKDIKVTTVLYNEHISTGLDQLVAQMHNWITVDYLHKVYVTIEHVYSLDNVSKEK